jgi:glycerol-3-phosphate dehydrogenase (NAD(P)+)
VFQEHKASSGTREPQVRVVVVGGGSWGTAFSRILANAGHEVTLACRDPEQARVIAETRRNPRYLTHANLSGVGASTVADAPIAGAELVVIAVPSATFAAVVEGLPGRAPVLSLTKGLDPGSGERLSTLVHGRPVAVLSGPNIAEEVSRDLPAAAVIASDDPELSLELQQAINSITFRIYVNDDVVGVELCAAAKNVIALAAGGADGLRLGDNAKAALVARGLAEMSRLAEAAGGKPETFAGLAGIGDLAVTCWAATGRNRRAGELIAQGTDPAEAVRQIGMVVEGLTTAPVLQALSRRLGIELPITDGVCSVLAGTSLHELVAGLMSRAPTQE